MKSTPKHIEHPYILAAYGTLRKNGKLHSYIKDAIYVRTVKLSGFKMYDTNYSFPIVVRGNKTDTIVADVYKLSKIEMENVTAIERGAGYLLGSTINQERKENNQLLIWIYPKDKVDSFKKRELIPSGDWITYNLCKWGKNENNCSVSA